MHSLLPCVLLLAPSVGEGHESLNPLYRELMSKGVMIGEAAVPLPSPKMADGLDEAAQTAILKEVIGTEYNYDDFIRPSPVAPFWLRLRDIDTPKAAHPVKGVDFVFLAYGDIKTVASQEFLDRVMEMNKDGGEARGLKAADLLKRKITIPEANAKQEGYGYLVFPLIDKVEVRAVGHGHWSQTADSVIAASQIDLRFADDAEFPNRWRPITKKPGGDRVYGEPRPYGGAAYYVKATRLAKPAGALFVETRIVFAEPQEWFDGANLLRSKLPPVIQSQVRSFRRELSKAKQ